MTARELPGALSAAIARLAGSHGVALARERAHALSQAYRAGVSSERAIRDDADLGAYLLTRLPATYAATAAAFAGLAERAPAFAPKTLLDAGAGPGTASWAAVSRWPGIATVIMRDSHARLLQAARELAQDGPLALKSAQFELGTIAEPRPALRFDLVAAAYVLNEWPSSRLEAEVKALWTACQGALVLVAPGTPAAFERILAARTLLLDLGAALAAPCPAAHRCPIEAPDWCHFSVRLPRSRNHRRAKDASVPFEDEKFSYLAAVRDSVLLSPPAPRILAPPRVAKGGIGFRLCTAQGIEQRSVLRRDKAGYRAAARKDWGDTFQDL